MYGRISLDELTNAFLLVECVHSMNTNSGTTTFFKGVSEKSERAREQSMAKRSVTKQVSGVGGLGASHAKSWLLLFTLFT